MKSTKTSHVFLILLVLGALGVALWRIAPERFPQPGPMSKWHGSTMGTTYEVKLAGVVVGEDRLKHLIDRVEAELVEVNNAMSTYQDDSEISRFNQREASTSEGMPVSERFQEVVRRSEELVEATGGAFDPTLGPLIDLWGFGATPVESAVPAEEQIEAWLRERGMKHLELREGALWKDRRVELNLSAIAKGYGVDRVVTLLMAEGYANVYVEIGGEVVCAGVNAQQVPWRIGVQVPEEDAGTVAMKVVRLEDQALATSGDYRNYTEGPEGRRHHILDPRTGHPADHSLASVSVIAADCMTADAVATALYVMGSEEGMIWLESHPEWEALFIDREGDGFRFTSTEGFDEAILAHP